MTAIIIRRILLSACVLSALLAIEMHCNKTLAEETGNDLTLTIENISRLQGSLQIAICSDQKQFAEKEKPFIGESIPVRTNSIVRVYAGLPLGEYAVKIYHDVNNNGSLDKTWFGKPNEPYGFSKPTNVKNKMPEWEAVSFTLTANGTNLTVRLLQ